MDRQIVYPGAIPLETDLLNTNKHAMMGLAKLAATMMGSNTYLHGLACTPSSPASMVVNVAKGQIYSLQNVDGTAYSSLPADTTNTILKQGIILGSTSFTLAAPTNAGQSINYLIQVAYGDVDSGATVLPYYNAANPSVAYSGPNNSGSAQNTVRSGTCVVALKAGVAATTGTQTTPAPDTGYTVAWVVTVAQGATSVTATNISIAPGAPFIPAAGVFSAIQQGTLTYAVDTGAANAYAASYIPALPALTDGMRLTFKAKTTNTGTCTFSANGGIAFPVYTHAYQVMQGGEIIANGLVEVEWNSTQSAWILCGSSGGIPTAPDMGPGNYGPQVANSKFVRDAINTLIGGAPENLNTLGELAQAITTLISGAPASLNTLGALALALGNNPNFASDNSKSIAALDNAKMAKSANGSDIADKGAFRGNLALGQAALRDVGSGTNQIPDMSLFPFNSNQTGYYKLPNGIIRQWGYIGSVPPGVTVYTSFPVPFPNKILSMGQFTGSPAGSAISQSVLQFISPTKSSFGLANIAAITSGSQYVANPVEGGCFWWVEGH